MLQLNPTVGVAPGTTTMTLGDASCPPDEPWQYVNPPKVQEGPPSGMSGLGAHHWNPYADWRAFDITPMYYSPSKTSLKGLGGASIGDTRWSFVIVAGVLAFAVTFGILYSRRKK